MKILSLGGMSAGGAMMLGTALMAAPALAESWIAEATLIASDGGQSEFFGQAVAGSGDTVLVGAWGHTQAPPTAAQGAAYVFMRNDERWTEQAKLMASDGQPFDAFGHSTALGEDMAVVGAPCHPLFGCQEPGILGSVYIFVRQEAVWSEQAKLTPSDGAALDFFGMSVALAGDTLVVGAPEAGVDGSESQGAVYVFSQADLPGEPWIEQTKLTAADGQGFDVFGTAVALFGDTLLIGAPGAGAVYIFAASEDGWSQQTRLEPSDGVEGFGNSVALSHVTLLVGAAFADIGDTAMRGAVYAFDREGDNWIERNRLVASDGDGHHGAMFGHRVVLEDDTAVVSAFRMDQGMGAAYVYTSVDGKWVERDKLVHELGGQLGGSVALSQGTIVLGAASTRVEDVAGQGAAHVFIRGSGAGTPLIDLDPKNISVTLEVEHAEIRALDISNHGEGVLEWTIHAEKGCKLPAWLAVDPVAGMILGGGTQSIVVAIDAAGLKPSTLYAELCLTSNDPERPFISVPVMLTVTGEPSLDMIFRDRYEKLPDR